MPAVTCAVCRADLGAGPLYRLRVGKLVLPHCEACAPKTHPWLEIPWMAGQRARRRRVCRHCGRLLYHSGAEVWPHDYCTEACARAARRERRRHPRRRIRLGCLRCGAEFVTTRTDARYCSSACKQAAYRQRKGEPHHNRLHHGRRSA